MCRYCLPPLIVYSPAEHGKIFEKECITRSGAGTIRAYRFWKGGLHEYEEQPEQQSEQQQQQPEPERQPESEQQQSEPEQQQQPALRIELRAAGGIAGGPLF